jgi:hypothetical protein
MGTPHQPDPDRTRQKTNEPADPKQKAPEEPKPFAFIERPHVAREVYISRPELGRDPAKRDK